MALDLLEKVSMTDLLFEQALGIENKTVRKVRLTQMKNELQSMAFDLRDREQKLSWKHARVLNRRLEDILCELKIVGYDQRKDYEVDFNSFVVGHKNFNIFGW